MDDATLKEANLKRRTEKMFGRIAQHNAEGLVDLGTRFHDALAEEMARVESDTTINQTIIRFDEHTGKGDVDIKEKKRLRLDKAGVVICLSLND